MTFTQRLPTTLLIAATTAGAAYVALFARGSGALELQVLRVIYIWMAALALVPWLILAGLRPSWRPASRLAPALLLCVLVFAISTVTSRFPRLSLEMLGYVVLLIEVYLLLVALMRRPALRLHFQRLALVLCLAVCGFFLYEVLNLWLLWWDAVGRLAMPPLRPAYVGFFTGPNPVATAALSFGAFGATAIGFDGRARWVGLLALLAVVLITTLITGSRGAWLGAGLGVIAVVIAIVWASPENRRRLRNAMRTRRAAIAIAIAIPLIAAAAAVAALSGRLTLEGGGYRAGFDHASLQMFSESPLTGVGSGTWGVLRASHSLPEYPDLYIPHAHSIYFQTLAEFGLLGVVAAIALVAALGILIGGALRSSEESRRHVGYSALFGVVLLAGQQYPDMLMNVPIVLLCVVLPIAWLDATALPALSEQEDARERRTPPGRLATMAGALITIVILVGLLRIEAIAGVAEQAVDAADAGDWPQASALTEQVVADDPDLNLYRFQLGVTAANTGALERAEQALETSASADDYRFAWLNLAAIRWKLGDDAGARDALARAERLGLQRPALAVDAGWLRQQLGDDDRAIDNYATAIMQVPSLAGDPFWESGSGPTGGFARILEIVDSKASPSTMLEIDLALDDVEDARRQAAVLGPSAPDLWPLVVPAWQGDETAWAALQALAESRPLDFTPAYWCRVVGVYRGDETAGARYGTWLAITASPDNGLPPIARLAFGKAEPSTAYVLDGYGSLYRRQVPKAQVVGFLPQLVLEDAP